MLDRQWVVSQCISLFMVVFGSACLAVASKYNWPEMKTAGAGIIGAGIQSITVAIRQQFGKHDPADLPPGGVQTDTSTSTVAVPPISPAASEAIKPA